MTAGRSSVTRKYCEYIGYFIRQIVTGLGRQLAVLLVLIAAVVTWLIVVGLGSSALRTTMNGDEVAVADAHAEGAATTMTDYLANEVVRSEVTPSDNIAAVRRWLADPAREYLQFYEPPTLALLDTTDDTVEVVLHENSEVSTFGNDRAWGHACLRYSVSASNELQVLPIPCPAGVPRDPSEP